MTIDGAYGEGGGQILRSSLSLSLVTGRPFRIERIRAGREKPGLRAQHLGAVQAATTISAARTEGAFLGSQVLEFWPGPVAPGDYAFAVGTAGSAALVLQTVLPALRMVSAPSSLVLEGGTHNPWRLLCDCGRIGSRSNQPVGFAPVPAADHHQPSGHGTRHAGGDAATRRVAVRAGSPRGPIGRRAGPARWRS
jgi:RNA 3'-terminal phosphate cyclase